MLLREGDVLVMQSAGGGGYGDPLARDRARVEQDVASGYVSAQCARSDYGVVVGDAKATQKLRRQIASETVSLRVLPDEAEAYEGIRGRHRVLRLHPSSGLEANQLIELLGRHPAPLRAWVKLDAGVPAGAASLDEFGRRVLGVEAGERVRLRKLESPVKPSSARR
jgi:N-methylhydantoinase B